MLMDTSFMSLESLILLLSSPALLRFKGTITAGGAKVGRNFRLEETGRSRAG